MEERLKHLLTLVIDMVKFAEAKNAAMLAASGAALLAIVNAFFGDNPPCGLARYYLYLAAAGLMSSALVAAISFIPQDDLPRIRTVAPEKASDNLMFFGHIQKYNAKAFLNALATQAGIETYQPRQIELALGEQIIINSRIASTKFTYFAMGIWTLLVALVTPAGAAVLYLYLHAKRERMHTPSISPG